MRISQLTPIKPLCAMLSSTSAYRCPENVRILAVIIAELELRNIERQILFADLMERADHAALNQRPEALNRVGVNCADNVFTLGVVDSDVLREVFIQVLVADPLIRNQQTDLVRNGFLYKAFQCDSADILDNAGDDIAPAPNCASDDGFAGTHAARSIAAATIMPVFGFSAHESLVNFNDPTKLVHVLFDQCSSDLVAHEPSRLVRAEAEKTIDLQRAHSLFARQHQVNDPEPVFERLIGVLKDRAGDVREAIGRVLGALIALPMPRIALQFCGLYSATTRAMNALGPAFTDQIGAASVLIRERLIELRRRQLVNMFFGRHDAFPLARRNMASPI